MCSNMVMDLDLILLHLDIVMDLDFKFKVVENRWLMIWLWIWIATIAPPSQLLLIAEISPESNGSPEGGGNRDLWWL
ncbi:hypothetical protein HanIR_Chr02g0097791 [Helianthus annuus]|nr:hypothetical protein HanIR_Chr02g0097791 [Helianthus annuus]